MTAAAWHFMALLASVAIWAEHTFDPTVKSRKWALFGFCGMMINSFFFAAELFAAVTR